MKNISVGLIGTGWAGAMHASSYSQIHGLDCRLKTVCSLDGDLQSFAGKYGFEQTEENYEKVLEDKEIDVIDIVTPPALHMSMIEAALKNGKHVICEKPLTGYFGTAGQCSGSAVMKREMYCAVRADLEKMERLIVQSGRQFCYAENWIYSPPFVRMKDLILKKGTRLLAISGETGHKGSHAAHAGRWSSNGGGSLIRQGTHPIAAALYLKQKEMEQRGEKYAVTSVLCDASSVMRELSESQRGFIAARPVDVEDWSHVTLTFSDGTKASITAGDIFLGGILNRIDVYGTDAVYHCNMTPNNLLELYWPDDLGAEQENVMEKIDCNLGWQSALVLEENLRGYTGELQDFLECIVSGRTPESCFWLAKETLRVIYAAYISAEEGRKVELQDLEKETLTDRKRKG